jgi:hypothetical protein
MAVSSDFGSVAYSVQQVSQMHMSLPHLLPAYSLLLWLLQSTNQTLKLILANSIMGGLECDELV